MAVDYLTLRRAFADSSFRNLIEVALADAAQLVLAEADATANHANRLKYAFRVLEHTETEAAMMLRALLPKNKAAASLAAIMNASDDALLSQVQALWNEFADHYAGG